VLYFVLLDRLNVDIFLEKNMFEMISDTYYNVNNVTVLNLLCFIN